MLKRRFRLIKQGLDDGSVLDDLNDVSVASPTSGYTIYWNGTTWVDGDITNLSGYVAPVTDHGGLTGLSDDDHPQYAQVAATETISAAWTFTTGPILSSGTPLIYWQETDQTTDEQYWRTSVVAKSWTLHATSDDLATLRTAFSATRGTTYSISGVALGNSTDLPMTTINGGLRVVHTRSPGSIAADQDDYAPTGYETVYMLRLSASGADRKINGFAGPQTGRILNIFNNGGTYNLILAHEAGTSTAANRFSFVNSKDHYIRPGEMATLIYDGTSARWLLVGGHSSKHLTTKGDLLSFGTYADRLAVGTDGHVLTADSTQTLGIKWAAASGGGGAAVLGYNPKYLFDWLDDMHSFDDEGWVTVTSGTGAALSQSTTRCSGTHFGVMELTTGTTSAGYAGAAFRATTPTTNVSTGYVLDADDLIFECLFYVEQVPTAAQNSAVRIGFVSDIDNPDINDTIQLRLRYNAAAVWTTATAGGTVTSNDYSSPTPATGWHHLKIVANSSSVKYYIDGTLLETCTTNIPTGAMVPSIWISKSAGTTAHLLSVDTIWIHKEFSTARNSNLSEPSVAFGIDALSDVDTTTDTPSNGDLLRFDGTNWVPTDVKLFSGTGSPESVVTANVGCLYLRTDGGASTTLYVKESGTGNTGWVAK